MGRCKIQKIIKAQKLRTGPYVKFVRGRGKCGKRRCNSVPEVELKAHNAIVFSPEGGTKHAKFSELRALISRWEKMFKNKQMGQEGKCESRYVPRANVALLSRLALEWSLREPNKDAALKRYLKRFFF